MKKRKLSQFLCTALMAVYILGVHDGKIALWKDGDPEPMQVFPYSAAALPDTEEARLKKGIRIESMDDLDRLLEAYLS